MPTAFRNALEVPVFVRVFDQIDQSWIAALREFSIQPKREFSWDLNDTGPAPSWNRAEFQINIKEEYPVEIGVGIIDPPDLTPTTPPTLYDANGVYLIYKESGRIRLRRFINPSLTIITPVANSTLAQSRLGKLDRLEARLNMNDRHLLDKPISDPDQYLSGIQVKFQLAYPNSPQLPPLTESARDISRLNDSGIATFSASYPFPRPGPVQIRGELSSSDSRVAAQMTSWVSATIQDTGTRQIDPQFLNPIASPPPTYPAITSVIQCILSTDAAHFFPDEYSVEYEFRRAGSLPPSGGWNIVKAEMVPAGAQRRAWRLQLPISGDRFPAIPPNSPTDPYTLWIRSRDAFKAETIQPIPFVLRDTTPPVIGAETSSTVGGPTTNVSSQGQVYETADPAVLRITFNGTVSDLQSGLKQNSLTYTIGAAPAPVTVANGRWTINVSPGTYGAFELRMSAEDNAGNRGLTVFPFEVVSSYRPATLPDLLSPQSYLRELQRLVNSELMKADGSSITLKDLETSFGHPFADLIQPNSPAAAETASDLLIPVRLLRQRPPKKIVRVVVDGEATDSVVVDEDATVSLASLSPLLGRWSFAELADGAKDDLIERFKGFGVRLKLLGRYWKDRNRTVKAVDNEARSLTTAKNGVGDPLETAFYSNGESCVEIGETGATAGLTRKALSLGKSGRDFSLSFWIWPQDEGSGRWRGVLFKGEEQPGADWATTLRRTPSIWLHPSQNRVHFRISTAANRNDGGDSTGLLPTGQWSHLAYVKRGRRLSLYLNGQLDSEVTLASSVVLDNDDPLYLGANPWSAGFKGGLAEFRIYGLALDQEDVRKLAVDRRQVIGNVSPLGGDYLGTVLGTYCRAAHESLLRGLGTSVEEVNSIDNMSPADSAALEKRLGFASSVGQPGSALQSLRRLPPPTNVQQFEIFLTNSFGLPPTLWDPVNQPALIGTPGVLWQRQNGLQLTWATEDANSSRWPDLDPDLVDFAELNPTAEAWRALHITRSGELATEFRKLSDPARTPQDLIGEVLNQNDRNRLDDLNADDAAGRPINDGLTALALDMPMFRRLLVYWQWPANQPLPKEQSVDLGHLLVEIWKRRVKREAWIREEAQQPTRLWPNTDGDPGWNPGRGKSDFLPWRASARRRAAFEARLSGRHRDWQTLTESHARLLLVVQRETLPALRDDLLGIGDLQELSSRLGSLAQLLLCDFSTIGRLELSAADQAAVSLQVLLNGVRQDWFGSDHPAASWSVRNQTVFDPHWAQINSLGRWRSSVLNALYPENTLYPELRKQNSQLFMDCLGALRALQPITMTNLADPKYKYAKAKAALGDRYIVVQSEWSEAIDLNDEPRVRNLSAEWANLEREDEFFVPIAEGLALQRAGQYQEARERYTRVYNVSLPDADSRRLYAVEPLSSQPVGQPARARLFDRNWSENLNDPHLRASQSPLQRNGCANPYTRFVLFQILRCLLDQAAAEHAAGTVDGLALARSLFLEAEDILAFEELDDVPPSQGGEAYLPNPVLQGLRDETSAGLRKIRLGLSFLGTPLPPDPTRGATNTVLSSLVRPTPYRYRVLVERAKQYAGLARDFEAQYLSALERLDAALEILMREGLALTLAEKTQTLRSLGVTEAETGKTLAAQQQQRSRIEADRYANWLAAGDNIYERQQIAAMNAARDWRQVANAANTTAASLEAIKNGLSVTKSADSLFTSPGLTAAIVTATITGGVAQGFVIGNEATAQLSALNGSGQRRDQEWQLRRDIAEQDFRIGKQGVKQADDRLAIAKQELTIAEAQTTQTQQMLAFLSSGKFTNSEFFEWLAEELSRVYSFFLQLATSASRQAELQLAFQRQESPRGLIRSDYWKLASADSPKDRRGITGSARLLQDLYELDQYAFSSEKRLLNLTQNFPLSQVMPVEFEEFRRTGVLSFETPMAWFDSGFPGHYLRLIKQVRISVAALIPPSLGIRATLSNNGLSRVVTADPGYPTVVIRQDPQSIALTSPSGANGLFELDTQTDLLYPFEGSGVDTTWFLEMPLPANPFNFDTLLDVVISIDYTALFYPDLRDRTIRSLPREAVGQRAFSLRRDLPDGWYELVNQSANQPARINLTLDPQQFPPGISELMIQNLAVSARRVDGVPCAFKVEPSVTVTPSTTVTPPTKRGDPVTAVAGLVSSRQSSATSWRQLQVPALDSQWSLLLSDDNSSPGFLRELRQGEVEDVYLVFSYSGTRPAWRLV
jgi:hypothetical protein